MMRAWCAICGAALRAVPSTDGADWLYVATATETRQATEPLRGFLGPPIYPSFEVAEGSVWATNLLPAATAGLADGRHYGHGVLATTGWFGLLVGHVHVPGRSVEPVRLVPDCCGWPMRLTPSGWCCRVDEDCAALAPLAA